MNLVGFFTSNMWIEARVPVVILIIICASLNYVCDRLGGNLEEISNDIGMDDDVAGATFLAVSSSLPEFLTSFISIVVYKKFEEVGFSTVAGSGIFNALLIPMFSILAYKGKINDFKPKSRDIIYYSATILVLTASMLLGAFSWMTGLALMGVYGMYVRALMKDQSKPIQWRKAKKKNIGMSLVWLVPIALLIHVAVHQAIELATIFGLRTFIVSVIVLAGVTSIPDLFMSINEARKGKLEGAVSNAVGSNVFDLGICLGMPLAITGAYVPTSFATNAGILGFLVASVGVTAAVLFTGIKKIKTIPMGLVYVAFMYYVSTLG